MITKIRNRLYIGLTISIILVISVAAISYQTFQRQNYQTDMIKHTYRVLNQLEVSQRLLIDMETSRRGFRSTNERKFLDRYYTSVPKIEPALNELRSLIAENPAQVTNFNNVQERVEDLLSFWVGLGEDASKNTRETIREINSREKIKMDAFRLEIEKMIRFQQALLKQRELENQASVLFATWELIASIALILVIVLVLVNLIIKEFKSRSLVQEELQNNYIQLEAANKESKDRNWQLAGVAEVNNKLQGSEEIKGLTQSVLDTLVPYINSQSGAFYIFYKDDNCLKLVASNAIPEDTQGEFKLNEGLVGQAASKTNPTVIKNIPLDQHVNSGTFSVKICEAVYLPIWLHNELKGVIEILSFQPLTEQSISFLKVVHDNIAVALHSAQAKEKVVRLLEQVQKQTEILENQQEELRQAYEDLSLQTETLQASEEELKVQEEELRQINAELEEKNKAIESARQELVLQAKELQVTSKYKTDFLANMSHELRTPLNSVLILAKLLAENKSNLTPKQIEHAKIIYKSGSDLLDLINDILDLSKIEAGKLEVIQEPVPVKDIASDIEQLFNVVAEERSINFTTKIDEDVPKEVVTDKQKVEQIIRNLLSNAFKFTSAKGSINLSFSSIKNTTGNVLNISVSDTGIGIARDKQQVIFEAFQQADMSTSRKFGGTGLGLFITKELLKLLNGGIELDSEEGKGSTFTISLPIEVYEKVEEKEKLNDNDIKELEEQASLFDDRNDISNKDKVILIIEDDLDFATIVKTLANEHGYKVMVAVQGAEGLEFANKYKPTAIILDMKLPVMDGRMVLKKLKADDELKHIPVHIISASEENKFVIPGAFAYLKKPVRKQDIEAVFATIDAAGTKAIKKVLLVAGDHLQDKNLEKFILDRHLDVRGDQVASVEEAVKQFAVKTYDCVIVDIGSNIEKGIKDLEFFSDNIRTVPVIVYVNNDITLNNELKLKKVSNVVVRSSNLSIERLMDELQLFLYKINDQQDKYDIKPETENDNGTDGTLSGRKVLVVDDDMRNVFALTELLEQEQMEIFTASDGKEALESLDNNRDIDIVLMDIMMPEMDGYEAIQHIRNDKQFTDLPIIALTAKAMAGDREKCIEAGASDYITKPVDTQKLQSLMRVWLSN